MFLSVSIEESIIDLKIRKKLYYLRLRPEFRLLWLVFQMLHLFFLLLNFATDVKLFIEWFFLDWIKIANVINCWLYLTNEMDHGIIQKQPPRGVRKKRCSENMQQISRRRPMPNSGFNKVAKQLYWNHTLVWMFSSKFAACF